MPSQNPRINVVLDNSLYYNVRILAEKHGTFTLAQARDYWKTTRRYVQDLLEYMDREGITLRVGDGRKLRG